MYQKAIAIIRGSIFPVFFELQHENLKQIGVSGTGFFVGRQGHFVTAYHVVMNIPAGARLFYIGNVPKRPLIRSVEIEGVYGDPVKDIFIGKISKGGLPPLRLASEEPLAGKSVCLSGYPLPRLMQNPDGSINVRNVRPYWQPTFVIDGIQANIERKQYKGFITQHTSLRGMSGGPVFDTEGLVCGMDVAMLRRKIPEPDGREIVVPNGVVVGAPTIMNILLNVVGVEL